MTPVDPVVSLGGSVDGQATQQVAAIAAFAGLQLSEARTVAVAAVLSDWLPAANELSRKMSSVQHRDLVPIVAFVHPHEYRMDLP